MLSLSPAAAPTASQWTKDVSSRTFMADVIEMSQHTPVLVDFWAPWCNPCKQLTPLLEKLTEEHHGALRLAKVNVDENQHLAQQLQIQSLPTVYIFFQRQPVDMFSGALPESQLRALLAQIVQMARGIPEILEEATTLLNKDAAEEASHLFEKILQLDPDHIKARVGLARCYLALHRLEDAQALTQAFPKEVSDLTDSQEIKALQTALQLATVGSQSQEHLTALRERAQLNPTSPAEQFELACALFHAQDLQASIDILLDIFRHHPTWEEGRSKTQLLTFLESLGFSHPMSIYGRKELSKILFS